MKEKYMSEAIKQAKIAAKKGDVPVGAVIVKDGKIIAKAHNIKNVEKVATRHAEIIAIEKAARVLNDWRLTDCQLYVTLEPCKMCWGAIEESLINIVYIWTKNDLCTKIEVKAEYGILENKCSFELKKFFKNIR